MKKRAIAAAAKSPEEKDLTTSPLPFATPLFTPNLFDFKSKGFATSSSKKCLALASTRPTKSSPQKTLTKISDLRDLVSSRTDSIKRHLDLSHAEILKDIEASHSRLSKRFKIQTQACQQVMDEAEKEYKKIYDRIGESAQAMEASYGEFIKEVQATTSRACKISIPELMQSAEKSIESLRSRYGIPLTSG
ncbi:PREDICTED: uncharacterized protein LOC104611214 [Nelumbo nucifera]|uniref:Uncharacterized protein LOC104611214 n=1 Tax=Nelumbo nucifera TaxID=4432 RepID=A0A1U8B9X3_NELNU|nr:PREDICTED: uncharacterized protein LOC104611214 [Nelumbo nucifera]